MSELDNHVWGMGWEDSDIPHPGFGGSINIYGGIVGQCENCGMYVYEFMEGGKLEGQSCSEKIRDF